MKWIKELLSAALNIVKDDSKLVVAICILATVVVMYLIEKGVIS